MDFAKVPVSSPNQGGDIDIYLFSNGQVYSPPRKYHLTAEELIYWDSTLNFLARSHYGYLHSSIDLYTIDGKKVDTPLELSNNNAYVAVESTDSFQPGGYDQYLMKASKSWIRRYGSTGSATTSKDKLNSAVSVTSENEKANNTNNIMKLEKVNEVKEVKEIEENAVTEAITDTSKILDSEMNKLNENLETTKLPAHKDEPKPGEKKKPSLQRSTVLKKNISNLNQTNDKKSAPLQKKRPGSPPKKNSINRVISPKKETAGIKTIYSPVKSKLVPSQVIVKNTSLLGADVKPEFIIPTKLTHKPENNIQTEPIESVSGTLEQDNVQANSNHKHIENEINKVEQEIYRVIENHQQGESFNQILYPKDEFVQETSTREYSEKLTSKNNPIPDALETIAGSINNNDKSNKNNHNDLPTNEALSTEIKRGNVINMRLSIEVKHDVVKEGEDTNKPPVSDFWNISIPLQEKCSQINIDEIIFQKEAMKTILENFNNKAVPNYMILRCDCCSTYFHDSNKSRDDKVDNENKTIHKNNKDYIILLPYIKTYDELFGCKCDESIITFDKIVQTSIVLESTEYTKSTFKQSVDHCTNADITSTDVKDISLHQSCANCKMFALDNKVTPPRDNQEKVQSTVPKENKETKTLPPKENQFTECPTRLNTREKDMLDKSTQTDSRCFLLEARRQSDGHYSFHLPPLHMVKLFYN